MTIHRIHSSTSTANPSEVGRFYRDIFGMDCRMGAGWSVTLEPGCAPLAQLEADDDDVDDVDVPGLEVEVEDRDLQPGLESGTQDHGFDVKVLLAAGPQGVIEVRYDGGDGYCVDALWFDAVLTQCPA